MSKCGTCGEALNIFTPDNLRAWIQPCGYGKDKPKYPAMCIDSGVQAWPAIEVSNLVVNLEGTKTPIYRRSFRNPCSRVLKGRVQSQPDDNTVDIQMDAFCGGLTPLELKKQKFNIYLQHVCCCDGGNEFLTSWGGAVSVIENVDFSGYSFANLVSTGNDTDTEIRIQLNSVTFDRYVTHTEMAFAEVASSAGLTTGAVITDAVFRRVNASGCGKDDCAGCQETWYAINPVDKNLIYQVAGGTIQESAVPFPGVQPGNSSFIGFIGSQIIITYVDAAGTDGYIIGTLDEDGNPPGLADWATVPQIDLPNGSPTLVDWRGILQCDDSILAFGRRRAAANNDQGIITRIGSDGSNEILLVTPDDVFISAMDKCGAQKVAVGGQGVIYATSGCGDTYSVLPSPTTDLVTAVSVRSDGEYWVGTEIGEVYCTTDGGQNWQQVQFPGASQIAAIEWNDNGTGYVVDTDTVFGTWDGGHEWTSLPPRFSGQPVSPALNTIDTPCCDSPNLSTNNAIFAGSTAGGVGAVYKAETTSCV